MNKEEKIVVGVSLITVLLVLLVLGIGAYYFYSFPPETVIVSVDKNWPVGLSDVEIENGIPVLEAGQNNFSNPMWVSKEAVIAMALSFDEKETFQKFFIDDNSDVSVMYVLLEGKDIYYATDNVILWKNRYYSSFLNNSVKKGSVMVQYHPDKGAIFFDSTAMGVGVGAASMMVGIFISMLIEDRRKKRKKKAKE